MRKRGEKTGFSAHIHMWDLSLWFSCISQFMEQTSVRLCLNNVEIHPVSKKTRTQLNLCFHSMSSAIHCNIAVLIMIVSIT